MIENIKQNWKKYFLFILVTLGSYWGYNITVTPKDPTSLEVPATDTLNTVDSAK